MQSPEAQPPEGAPDLPTGAAHEADASATTASQAESRGNTPTEAAPPQEPREAGASSSAEQMLYGDLVYPPPPSFYQSLPPDAGRTRPFGGTTAAAARLPQPAAPQVPPPSSARPDARPPSYAGSPLGSPGPGGRPRSSSRTWIWVTLAIIAISLVTSLSLCSWAFYNTISSAQRQYDNLSSLVDDYYDHIQRQDYAHAFLDLQPSTDQAGLTPAQFSAEAQARDRSYGPVISYSIVSLPDFSLQSGPTYGVQVDVKRTHLQYSVLLTVRQINGTWKIVDFDRI